MQDVWVYSHDGPIVPQVKQASLLASLFGGDSIRTGTPEDVNRRIIAAYRPPAGMSDFVASID
eukprot:946143-Prorocentrum_minimum.AAC.1